MEPESNSPSTDKNEKIELNVTVEQVARFLALTTTAAAAIAVAFDLGYFSSLDINMFTLFSLSEHILFSLEALPGAMVFSTVIMVALFLVTAPGGKLVRRYVHASGDRDKKKTRTLIVRSIGIIIIIFGAVYGALRINFLFITLLVLPIFAILKSAIRINFVVYSVVCTYIYSFIAAFSMGAEIARKYTSYDAEALHQITTKDHTTLGGRLIRSGERGLLFFDTEKKQVAFFRWESIDSIRGLPRSSHD